jgi:hypothetical protein
LIGIRRRRYVKGTWHGRKIWQGKDVAGAGGEHNPPPPDADSRRQQIRGTRLGKARLGVAGPGEEQGRAWLGLAGLGWAWHGEEQGVARPGVAGLGMAWQGEEQGWARRGWAWLGRAWNMAWENVHRFSEPWGKRDARTGQAIRKDVGNGSIRGYFDGLDAADHACG